MKFIGFLFRTKLSGINVTNIDIARRVSEGEFFERSKNKVNC
jgi:hypothetical protein